MAANPSMLGPATLDPELAALLGEVSARLGVSLPSKVVTERVPRPHVCVDCAKIPSHMRPEGWREDPGMIVYKDGVPIQTAQCARHTKLAREKKRQEEAMRAPIAMPKSAARRAPR